MSNEQTAGDGEASRADLLLSATAILDSVELCSISTVTERGEPQVATAYFAYEFSDDLSLWILTPPSTVHTRNLVRNPSAAIGVYRTDQPWGTQKQGLQVLATSVLLTSGADEERAITAYGNRFSGFPSILSDKRSLAGLESRFIMFAATSVKVFDEPRFGDEVWVTLTL